MPRRAVVLTFDRCHLGYLPCYGNDWVETPHWNRLALSSVVFDECYAEDFSSNPESHAWWTGRYQYPVDPRAEQTQAPDLATLLRNAGVRSHLLIEAGDEPRSRTAPKFDEVKIVRGRDGLDVSESEIPFARLVQAAEPLLQEPADVPQLIWLKSRGIPLPWLPPKEFTDLYFAELGLEDEAPLAEDDEGDTPSGDDSATDDPDDDESPVDSLIQNESDGLDDPPDPSAARFTAEDADSIDVRYAKAFYAGYVTCLDRWLGRLLSHLADRDSETLLIVTAAAGSSVGDRGALDETVPVLREEQIHVPLIVRVPNRAQDGSRRRAFVQTVDIAPTLLDWFGIVPSDVAGVTPDESAESSGISDAMPPQRPASGFQGYSLLPLVEHLETIVRDYAVMGDAAGARALRTADFFLARDRTGAAPRLFAKPYDRWDMQDLSREYPDVVEQLVQQLAALP